MFKKPIILGKSMLNFKGVEGWGVLKHQYFFLSSGYLSKTQHQIKPVLATGFNSMPRDFSITSAGSAAMGVSTRSDSHSKFSKKIRPFSDALVFTHVLFIIQNKRLAEMPNWTLAFIPRKSNKHHQTPSFSGCFLRHIDAHDQNGCPSNAKLCWELRITSLALHLHALGRS